MRMTWRHRRLVSGSKWKLIYVIPFVLPGFSMALGGGMTVEAKTNGSIETEAVAIRRERILPETEAMPAHPDTLPVAENQGELLPVQVLEQVEVHRRPLTAEERNEYLRLVYNVRRTYPYAVLAKERMEQYNAIRDSLHAAGRKRESRKYLKEQEQQIRDDFLEDLKNMTKSQGAILIKLLARQTDTTAYFLLKDFRGGARAFAYQTMAVFWGYDLKAGYDPEGEDWDIESVVRLIEQKRLSTIAPRKTPALDKKAKKNKKKAAKAKSSAATAPATLPKNSYGGLHTQNRN